ncbi:MAG: tetraacyldisaccharide 4'-kinase [candidate division Zixibacteria bacterium]|nr:tetraacyldisaccharide 4'-kinase [candidate division Zixibacteria bacterium]
MILKPFAFLYWMVVAIRNKGYDIGVFKAHSLPKPVLSVGNITVGGTGKTPVVRMLCEKLLERGLKPAILSRGYMRKGTEDVIFKSPPPESTTADTIGDEPYMLSRQLNGVIFGISANRRRVGMKILESHNPDIFVLDDGFQHRQLRRDVDFVVLDSDNPFGGNANLPRGMLREHPSSLARADIILIRNSHQESSDDNLSSKVRSYAPDAHIFDVFLRPEKIISLAGTESERPEFLKHRPVFAFCGIANPEGFKKTLESLQTKIMDFVGFRDHHRYSSADVERLNRKFMSSDAEFGITTMKDGAKLSNHRLNFPLYTLDVIYVLKPRSEEILLPMILNKLN